MIVVLNVNRDIIIRLGVVVVWYVMMRVLVVLSVRIMVRCVICVMVIGILCHSRWVMFVFVILVLFMNKLLRIVCRVKIKYLTVHYVLWFKKMIFNAFNVQKVATEYWHKIKKCVYVRNIIINLHNQKSVFNVILIRNASNVRIKLNVYNVIHKRIGL